MALKKLWIGLLTAILLFSLTALAEESDSFEELGEIGEETEAKIDIPSDGGLVWDESSITISVPEDASTGYAWASDLDDEGFLTLADSSVSTPTDGGLPVHSFRFEPAADGEALISLYYEETDGENVDAVLIYYATIEDGKIIDAWYEDMSDWGEGDEEGGVLYEGESGGVALYLPEDVALVSEENGIARLENEDKTIWVTIEYDPDGDPDALLEEFEDESDLEAKYPGMDQGGEYISSFVDLETDPPKGTLVYETYVDGVDSIVEFSGYKAPNGGILKVYTGYGME